MVNELWHCGVGTVEFIVGGVLELKLASRCRQEQLRGYLLFHGDRGWRQG